MARRSPDLYRCSGILLLCGTLLGACAVGTHPRDQAPRVWNTAPASLRVPETVHRLAVLYPTPSSGDVARALARLESAAFQLKVQRPDIRIVERVDLPAVFQEQVFQLSGSVSDASAVRLGRIFGVDAILLYRIDAPGFRERVFARATGDFPPFVITSKVIVVESGEVVFHDVVTSTIDIEPCETAFLSGESRVQRAFRAALDHGVIQTMVDLKQAFR
ncbi:MAG: hypothetical protein ACREI3_11495 [Nitrospirales bacterium]